LPQSSSVLPSSQSSVVVDFRPGGDLDLSGDIFEDSADERLVITRQPLSQRGNHAHNDDLLSRHIFLMSHLMDFATETGDLVLQIFGR